jgi:hypothetical protein
MRKYKLYAQQGFLWLPPNAINPEQVIRHRRKRRGSVGGQALSPPSSYQYFVFHIIAKGILQNRIFICPQKRNLIKAQTHQRVNVVVNSVCARVCPVSAQSMDSRSAVGWVMSMSTAYNLNTYRCVVLIGGQGG